MKRTLTAALLAPMAVLADVSPSLWYSFDEMKDATHIADLSGNGHDLQLQGGAVLTNLAAVGNALWFDGAYGTRATFVPPHSATKTLAFWFYRSEEPGPYYRGGTDEKNAAMPTLIAGLDSINFRFYNVWFDKEDPSRGVGDYQVVAYAGEGGSLGAYYPSYQKYPTVGTERWAHYALVFDVTGEEQAAAGGQTVHTFDYTFYVNGEVWFAQKGAVVTNLTNTKTAAALGNNGVNRPACGAIDELKVWPAALDADEIKAEFARGSATRRVRLVAHYPFQEFSERDEGGACTSPDATPFALSHERKVTCSVGTSVTNGPHGTDKAIHFDGLGYGYASANIPYSLDDYTMSAWVNISTNTSIIRIAGEKANYPRLITMGKFASYYTWSITETKMQYMMPGEGSIRNFDTDACTGKGNWQYCTWVVRNERDPETAGNSRTQRLELYLNGELAKTGPDVAAGQTGKEQLIILGSQNTAFCNRPFEGDLADFRIYDGALTAEEVKRLARGVAKPEAGADATVAGAKAVLAGSVASSAGEAIRTGYDGAVGWSLVSAPAGGEGVSFMRPENPVTEVTLPVEGAYVFRLTVTGLWGETRSDTVAVTRNDASGEAPVVPAVDVAKVAAEAQVAAGLTNGLMRYWTGNGLGRRDEATGKMMAGTDFSKGQLVPGLTGDGFRAMSEITCAKFITGFTSGEVQGDATIVYNGNNNYRPKNEWLTVSAWICPDENAPNDWHAAAVFHIDSSLSICYGQYGNPKAVNGPIGGFSILQTGFYGGQSTMNYAMPAGETLETLAGRWTHIVAIVNRHDTSKSRFYLNGKEQTTASRSTPNYSDTEERVKPFQGTPCGGRIWNGSGAFFGNVMNEVGGVNNIVYQSSNTTSHVCYNRRFHGVVDEVRLYGRELTESEVAFLATHPDPHANEAPVVTKPTLAKSVVRRVATPIAAEAADDGNGTKNGAVSCEWVVARGDASKVAFGDRTARETTVTVTKSGTYAFLLKVTDGERTTWGEPVEVTLQAGFTLLLR